MASEYPDCLVCERPSIPATLWKSRPDLRDEWKAIDGRQGASRGLCRPCWLRMKAAGRLDEFPVAERPACAVDECGVAAYANGYCGRHYRLLRKYGKPYGPTEEDRFWPKVDTSAGPDECWPWAATRRPDGYGLFRFDGRMGRAHRFSHLRFIGPIPDGYEVDHLCKNPPCVNPAHLEAVPPIVNNYRSDSWAGRHQRATHCPQGHPFDDANTYRPPSGGRQCRTCRRHHRRAAEARSRARREVAA
jgi:hypothetical protein